MSLVILGQRDAKVDIETLRSIASKSNIKLNKDDEEQYRSLLDNFDATADLIAKLPAYVPSQLRPEILTNQRKHWKEPNNPLNAWSHRTNITAAVPASPRSHILAGIDVAIKDNVSIAGVPLTGGTFPEILTGKSQYPIPQVDAVVVSRILDAGGTIVGSATCEHLSMTPLSYTSASGPVHNPWRKGYTAGGSSSGPGALVGITQIKNWRERNRLPASIGDEMLGSGATMAIGGDQGGSIRIPAAYNGIYGLKPTHGLVPYTGIIGLVPMIDHVGPMCTSLDHVAKLLGVIAGWDGVDPRMTPESPKREDVKDYSELLSAFIARKTLLGLWMPEHAGSGMRIGVIKEAFEVPGLSDEVCATVCEAVARFSAIGATVEDVSIPLHALGPAIWTVATRIGIATHGFQNHPPSLLDYPLPDVAPPPLSQAAYETLTKYNPAALNIHLTAAYLQQHREPDLPSRAMLHAHELRRAYDDALDRFDVLVTPINPSAGMPHPAPEQGVGEKMALSAGATSNTCGFNITGHPALAMPVGFGISSQGGGGTDVGLPIGMQIVGRRFDEETVLRVAAAWEVPGLGLDGRMR